MAENGAVSTGKVHLCRPDLAGGPNGGWRQVSDWSPGSREPCLAKGSSCNGTARPDPGGRGARGYQGRMRLKAPIPGRRLVSRKTGGRHTRRRERR